MDTYNSSGFNRFAGFFLQPIDSKQTEENFVGASSMDLQQSRKSLHTPGSGISRRGSPLIALAFSPSLAPRPAAGSDGTPNHDPQGLPRGQNILDFQLTPAAIRSLSSAI